MKKKVSGKEIFGAVLLIAIIAVFAVYMWVYKDYRDRTEILEQQNQALQEEVDAMKQYFDEMPIYIQESNEMIAQMDKMLADYPADAREEEGIMMAVEMQKDAQINYDSIGISGNNTIHVVPQEVVDAAAVESIPYALEFKERSVTYSNVTNYSNLRSCIETIYKSVNRIGVNNVVYQTQREAIVDENGEILTTKTLLRGTIGVSFYNLQGTDKVYTPPVIPDYISGTDNIFAYVEPVEDEEAQNN